MRVGGLDVQPDHILSPTGQNPCGPLAGNRDRDRRPCEGFPHVSATRPVASARSASRCDSKSLRDAVVRLAVLVAQPLLAVRVLRSSMGYGHSKAEKTAHSRVAVLPKATGLFS
jgi:hypothetical protein